MIGEAIIRLGKEGLITVLADYYKVSRQDVDIFIAKPKNYETAEQETPFIQVEITVSSRMAGLMK